MLQRKAVYADTLELLIKLMQMPELEPFVLVGGTALALQIGHRISVDLDLFAHQPFDNLRMTKQLSVLGKVEVINTSPSILQMTINEVKVDMVNYPYDFIQNYETVENVRLLPIDKIAVMKLMAIANRGTKRDFVDLYFLLKKYSFMEIMQFFSLYFPHVNPFHILKSLSYFEDAENQTMPTMLEKTDWEKVKKTIYTTVQKYLKN